STVGQRGVASEPSTFRHNWARMALREGLVFLLIAGTVVIVSGLFLPISGDHYWMLIKIVLGSSAVLGTGLYLANVLPRLCRAFIVRRYGEMPRVRRTKWQEESFGCGFKFVFLATLAIDLGGLIISKWDLATAFPMLFAALAFGLFGGFFWFTMVKGWNELIDDTLQRFSLSRQFIPPSDDPGDPAESIEES